MQYFKTMAFGIATWETNVAKNPHPFLLFEDYFQMIQVEISVSSGILKYPATFSLHNHDSSKQRIF